MTPPRYRVTITTRPVDDEMSVLRHLLILIVDAMHCLPFDVTVRVERLD